MTEKATLTPLTAGLQETLRPVGYSDERAHAATSVIVDHHAEHIDIEDDRVEILPIADALRKYEWVQDRLWGLISADDDEVLAKAAASTLDPIGTFVHVKEGAKLTLPVQSFTTMTKPHERQHIHDLTIVGAGAEVEFVSGVATSGAVHSGRHVSLSETYIGEGATVRSVTVEQWGRDVKVHNVARTRLADGANLHPVSVSVGAISHHVADDFVEIGKDAVLTDYSVTRSPAGAHRVLRWGAELAGEGARAESVARMVADGGVVHHTATIVGRGDGSRGHLACDGLKTSAPGELTSIPALRAFTDQAQLSHEASVGMVSEEKLAYLMSTGLDEDQARDVIVQGFLAPDEDRIPESMRATVADVVAASKTGGM